MVGITKASALDLFGLTPSPGNPPSGQGRIYFDGSNVRAIDANGSNLLLSKQTTLISAAQILTLRSVPVTIIPSPGPGLTIIPIACFVIYTFKTAHFTLASQNLLTEYGPASGVNAFGSTAIQATLQSSSSKQILLNTIGLSVVNASQSANTPITARLSVSDPTGGTGDSTLTYIVYYDIAATP